MRRLFHHALLTLCLFHLGVLAAGASPARWTRVGATAGRWIARASCPAVAPAVADFDGNGVADGVDVGSRHRTVRGLRVRLNGGRPRIISRHEAPCRLLVADIDHDTDPDLIAITRSGRLLVWRNDRGRLRLIRPAHAVATLADSTVLHDVDRRQAERAATGPDHTCLAPLSTCGVSQIATLRLASLRELGLSSAPVSTGSRGPPIP